MSYLATKKSFYPLRAPDEEDHVGISSNPVRENCIAWATI